MYGYVYLTTNLINGKKYIGMHKWNKDTIDESYYGSGIHLVRALNQYGKENFKVEIIEWCNSREELSQREAYWISYYKAPINEDFYNIEDGGFGGHTEYYVQPQTQKQLDALEYGRHLPSSQKQKQKLSAYRKSLKGNPCLQTIKGKICINKDGKNKYIYPNELENYIDLGWSRGPIRKPKNK